MEELNQALKDYQKLLEYVPKLKANGHDVSISFASTHQLVTIGIYLNGWNYEKELDYYFVFDICKKYHAEDYNRALAKLEELTK